MAKNGFFKKTFRKAKASASEKYESYRKEKAQEVAAGKLIRKKAKAAGLREKETQAIRYAQETEKYRTSERLKAMKRPRTTFSQGMGYLAGPTTKKRNGSAYSKDMNTLLGTGSGFIGAYAKSAVGKPKTKMTKATTYVRTKGGYKKQTVYRKRKLKAKPQKDALSVMMGV
tara:strand:+ start:88 stop:600 length:513 start_codon:yes stop_codon:yes gene_type:complete